MEARMNQVSLGGLSLHLAILSLSAIGGGVILVAPDVHDYVAVQHQWITSEQFAAAYALAQAAPGPNALFITLIGWMMDGFVGALAATLAVVLPSSLLALGVGRLLARRGATPSRWGDALRDALAPLSAGMMGAAAWTLLNVTGADARTMAAALACAAVVYATKVNPVYLVALGALAGVAGLL
jgi:chromate transporter